MGMLFNVMSLALLAGAVATFVAIIHQVFGQSVLDRIAHGELPPDSVDAGLDMNCFCVAVPRAQ
jgi:hypothetical protein